MSDKSVTTDIRGRIGILTIDRPRTLNALDIPTLLELEAAFVDLEANPAIGVIVVTGAGDRAFVAGGDIRDLESRQALAHYHEFAEAIHRVLRRIEICDKPTIAAVNGWALGGGTELILAMDIRILADNARLGLPEITLGIMPGAGGTQRLIRQVPLCRAKEIMFAGEHLKAQTAVDIGLANRAVPRESLMDETLSLAAKIAEKSPSTLKFLKRTLGNGADMPLPAALAYEQSMVSLLFDSADAHEGCRAFLDKRKPNFTGS